MSSPDAFSPFDPLLIKDGQLAVHAQRAKMREIENILSSYVGWWDPFCELIQNALDAVDARRVHEASASASDYKPQINVIVDTVGNQLTVSDNGTGMSEDEFQAFLAPNFSFKESKTTRGHKGVGATYLAYGFNYMRVHTRFPGFDAAGVMTGALTWVKGSPLDDPPLVEPDDANDWDDGFSQWKRGTTVTVRFDDDTQPRKLSWLAAKDAETWLTMLRVKTGLGSVTADPDVNVTVTCITSEEVTTAAVEGISYLWLRDGKKSASLKDVSTAAAQSIEKSGNYNKMPNKYKQLAFMYETWSAADLKDLLSDAEYKEQENVITRHSPTISMEYGYTTKLWRGANDALDIRANHWIFKPGIQLAANGMPQGEVIQVPLTKYIGRQNQVHFLIHFENYTPDLGRKGFSRDLQDFATTVTQLIVQFRMNRLHQFMKRDTGQAPDLGRRLKLDEWKQEIEKHEKESPLTIDSEHFFHPTKRISITSTPTREQDVIALFHELLSGGVIRGLHTMSTNERFTYDGLYRLAYEDDEEMYEYAEKENPLGIVGEALAGIVGKTTSTFVLEYKYSLDGLIADLLSQDKNIQDIDLCVAWEMGEDWTERYSIRSLLIPENIPDRQFHGVTHALHDESEAFVCHLIILQDLIQCLVDPDSEFTRQRELYEDV